MTGTPDLASIATRIAEYLAGQWRSGPVEVTHIEQVFGGASRETFRFKAATSKGQVGLILRRDPPTSLIDTERRLEYGAYKAMFPTDIPVPEPLFLEEDPVWLGQPFSVMAEITDARTDVASLNAEQRARIGQQKWRLLGKLAVMDPIALGFGEFTPVPALDSTARTELDYWAGVIDADQVHPQPIASAAIRWLRRNMPPPAQKLSIVHGDYRTGNFLFDPSDGIKGILDWEMCHLGDPLEDLAWSLDPLWSWGESHLAGRLLPPDEAIGIWEAESGLKVDRETFNWWRVFVAIKALAIWISSSEDFEQGASHDAILAYAGWVMTDRQNRILLDYLSPLSKSELGGRVG